MEVLTTLELQNIKKLVTIQDVNYKKYLNYSDYSVDPQIKQTFNKAAQDALNAKENLLGLLSQ